MNKKICFYKLNGTLKDEVAFNEENLKSTFGMKVRCVFEDGTEKIGYACCNDNYYKNNMIDCIGNFELWTLKNFNIDKPNMVYEQEFTSVDLTNVERIDAILHSNPRWGTIPSNKFEFAKDSCKSKDFDIPDFLQKGKYIYVYVEYEDDVGGKLYCYRTEDNTIKKGMRVLVKRNDEEVCAKVISVKKYNLDELPYPLEKTKFILKQVNEHYKPYDEIIECKHFYGEDVILSYTLNDAWMQFIDGFMIIDKKENNIVFNDPLNTESIKFTIPYEDIKNIKNVIKNNNEIFNIKDIPMPNVLDGTEHEFYFSTKKNMISFETWNLWYWLENLNETTKEIKLLLTVVAEINNILKPYDLKIDLKEN